MPDSDRVPTGATSGDVTPSPSTGSAGNDLFSPQNGQTSTAGANFGGDSAGSVGRGPEDLPGGTLDRSSALGSDEAAPTSIPNVGTDSALGSDPTRQQPATIGGQSLLMENDNATSNSNAGASPDDTSAI